jgi:Flp pilus assembly protein protease CpaA
MHGAHNIKIPNTVVVVTIFRICIIAEVKLQPLTYQTQQDLLYLSLTVFCAVGLCFDDLW